MILLILLVAWLDLPVQGEPYEVLEMFAGVGRIAALSKRAGFKSAAIDIEYAKEKWKSKGKRSPMDINSDAGLVSFVCKYIMVLSCSEWFTESHACYTK